MARVRDTLGKDIVTPTISSSTTSVPKTTTTKKKKNVKPTPQILIDDLPSLGTFLNTSSQTGGGSTPSLPTGAEFLRGYNTGGVDEVIPETQSTTSGMITGADINKRFNIKSKVSNQTLAGEGKPDKLIGLVENALLNNQGMLPKELSTSELAWIANTLTDWGMIDTVKGLDDEYAAEVLGAGVPVGTEALSQFYTYDANTDTWYLNADYEGAALGVSSASGGGGGRGFGGGGGGGGGSSSGGVNWSLLETEVEGAPDWWVNKIPNQRTDTTQYLMFINSLIPYLSPEDQRSMAAYLYQVDPKAFAEYNPDTTEFPAPPLSLDTATRFRYTSAERANQAMSTLQNVVDATGFDMNKLGPGYQFLQNVLSMLSDYGGESEENQQTRAQAAQQYAGIKSLLDSATGKDLSPYSALASALSNPYFTAGRVTPISKSGDDYIFGEVNPRLFA